MTRTNFIQNLIPILIAATLLAPPDLLGQSRVGTTAAPFLTIGVGSRPIGMGGAFVSMTDDAYSIFWNPAALARMNHSEIALVHTDYLADMDFNFIGAVFILGEGRALGVSATLLNVGEMEVTTEAEQDGTGIFFNSYDLAMGVTYSFLFYDKFSMGVNAKYIYQAIWHETASGVAIDLGTLLITPLYDIRLGMNISNFGTDMQMTGKDLLVTYDPASNKQGNNENIYSEIKMDKWQLPLTMRVGLSGEVIQNSRDRVTLAMDWVHPNDNTEFLDIGAEYSFRETFALRTGYKSLRPNMNFSDGFEMELSPKDSGGGLTFGAGLHWQVNKSMKVKLDYAFETFDRLGSIHKYSLGFGF